MVDTLDEETLNHWHAVALIDGWGQENWRMARLAAAIHNSLIGCFHRQGVLKAEESDFHDAEHYLPKLRFETGIKATRKQSAAEIEAICKQMAGVR